jgi:hypothetical protein
MDKPVGDRILHAMAQAYPDPVDLYLLSMVLGCDAAVLRERTGALVDAGLAQAQIVKDDAGDVHPEAPLITDRGMAVALGLARDAEDAQALLARLEARTLRALLAQRVKGSRLPTEQADELRGCLDTVADDAMVDAAKVWAHQPVSDWRALIHVLLARRDIGAAAPI